MIRWLRRLGRAVAGYAYYRDLPAAFQVAEVLHRALKRRPEAP